MRTLLTVGLTVAIASCGGLLAGGRAAAGEKTRQPGSRFVRIGHYQCICRQGDFEANLKTVILGLKLASEAGLDVVSFPESFLTGYYSSEKDTRTHCFAIDSPQIKRVLKETAHFQAMFMVGFNELRQDKLYNTVALIERGKLLGHYSKAMPCYGFFAPGREFPVFEKKGLKFGVIICADGGYVEPARILALKGAKLIFAPHYNFVSNPVRHYQMVRNDHIARAVENGVYFLRGNTVDPNRHVAGLGDRAGYGYGDSYLLNPNGEVVAAAGLYHEYLMVYNLDLGKIHRSRPALRSRQSASALNHVYQETLRRTSEAGK